MRAQSQIDGYRLFFIPTVIPWRRRPHRRRWPCRRSRSRRPRSPKPHWKRATRRGDYGAQDERALTTRYVSRSSIHGGGRQSAESMTPASNSRHHGRLPHKTPQRVRQAHHGDLHWPNPGPRAPPMAAAPVGEFDPESATTEWALMGRVWGWPSSEMRGRSPRVPNLYQHAGETDPGSPAEFGQRRNRGVRHDRPCRAVRRLLMTLRAWQQTRGHIACPGRTPWTPGFAGASRFFPALRGQKLARKTQPNRGDKSDVMIPRVSGLTHEHEVMGQQKGIWPRRGEKGKAEWAKCVELSPRTHFSFFLLFISYSLFSLISFLIYFSILYLI
jgi:hypothetical protein